MQSTIIKYGDHVDTDVIIPARYLNTTDAKAYSVHCMEDLDPDFQDKLLYSRIIVAGRNFGCGSSREHAPMALKTAGVQCIIADSFARIFFRNAINIGLPIIECPPAAHDLEAGQTVVIDLSIGQITCTDTGKVYAFAPFPPFMQNIIEKGGLMPSLADEGEAQA